MSPQPVHPTSACARGWRKVVTLLKQWWDTDHEADALVTAREDRFDLRRSIPYIFLHLGCLLVLWVGWSPVAVGVAVFLYAVRMFAVTAFYHRYFSHRAFRTSRFMQFVFAVLGNTSMQRGPLWWAATHRHHHQHSDEEEDKHSPVQSGFWWAHFGWLTSASNFPTDYSKINDLTKFPELMFLNRRCMVVPLVYGAFLWAIGASLAQWAPSLGVNGAQLFVWGFFVSTVVLLHGTLLVNSLAHTFGKRRFDTGDDSRNSLFIALVTLGEGWHNNHHRYAGSARQGFYWWEIDVSYYLLRVLAWMGLIWDLRPVPQRVYEEVKAR